MSVQLAFRVAPQDVDRCAATLTAQPSPEKAGDRACGNHIERTGVADRTPIGAELLEEAKGRVFVETSSFEASEFHERAASRDVVLEALRRRCALP